MSTEQQVVLSGIRATGKMHIGNYFGALERFARMSCDPTMQCFFFVADLHTLTTHKEAERIRREAPEIVLDMLAAGVDPGRSTIYAQSQVPVVAELAWYLACLTPYGDLSRIPTFKDKAEKHADDVNAGLFLYPVLMAADILGPRANLVPVGADQKPHIELARDIAGRFNQRYGKFFPIPDPMEEEMLLVPALAAMDDQGRFPKMGKSEDPAQTLFLSEDPEKWRAKLKVAPTDPARQRREDPGTPEHCAIFQLHPLTGTGEDIRWSSDGCRTAGIGCVECKDRLAGNLDQRFAEFRERRRELSERPEGIRDILASGANRAWQVFDETTAEVADRMGVFRIGRSGWARAHGPRAAVEPGAQRGW